MKKYLLLSLLSCLYIQAEAWDDTPIFDVDNPPLNAPADYFKDETKVPDNFENNIKEDENTNTNADQSTPEQTMPMNPAQADSEINQAQQVTQIQNSLQYKKNLLLTGLQVLLQAYFKELSHPKKTHIITTKTIPPTFRIKMYQIAVATVAHMQQSINAAPNGAKMYHDLIILINAMTIPDNTTYPLLSTTQYKLILDTTKRFKIGVMTFINQVFLFSK